MQNPTKRKPHAALQPKGRLPKAEKIRRLLELPAANARPIRLLEIGTGSGAIAQYFAVQSDFDCEVDAVDVVDQRKVLDGYRFMLVEGAILPFDNARFDVVISNHVLEHVGDRSAQVEHLREISRVLRDDGLAYLATPNRWQVVEPHYHLAFLSWLPRSIRSSYLRLRERGDYYDCEPLGMFELEPMLSTAGFRYSNVCESAFRALLDIEKPKSLILRMLGRLPDGWFGRMRAICPTHIYILRRTDGRTIG